VTVAVISDDHGNTWALAALRPEHHDSLAGVADWAPPLATGRPGA
jgi:hypothetical protein